MAKSKIVRKFLTYCSSKGLVLRDCPEAYRRGFLTAFLGRAGSRHAALIRDAEARDRILHETLLAQARRQV
jgi:hypothetical protein